VRWYHVVIRRQLRTGRRVDVTVKLRARCLANVPNGAARKLGYRNWDRLLAKSGEEQPMVLWLVQELPRKAKLR
jgi:hypothetical protein